MYMIKFNVWISTENNIKLYYGACKAEFKSRSPREIYPRERGIEVDLSKYIWQLINQSKKLQHTFESTYVYNTLQMRHKTLWDICPTEKHVIAPDYQEQ